jgi:hypothetical protein
MQADEASDAHEGEHALSYHSQNSAIIAESTGEIKGHAPSPQLPMTNQAGWRRLTCTLPVVYPSRRSQAKAGANALPQGAFLLDTDQSRETFPIRIEKH